ncbi:protein PLASTID MOVEMENT IMPAIRED 1 [Argentina anserina]|uniref:protein PLASTID MOVEMENT IMPAIRED 1 n=1 Tax=Argentina anserina TaxID=57926 RepID=UPI0021768DB2|nr:protein PLASTID MOVEMENT IMPAIRED 1 [Potentilla anserina]
MAAAENSSGAGRRNSNTQLLEELEALSESLYQSHTSTTTTRRTASLALPRSSVPSIPSKDEIYAGAKSEDIKASVKPLRRRLSLSPWRSRPNDDEQKDRGKGTSSTNQLELKSNTEEERSSSTEKKGIWNWKPIRAISHIGMHKISCLFSVEVVTAQGLPASMNGLRLSICVRKKESKDGAVQTMPSRVTQGAADFEETLFFRCHVYCSSGQGKPMKFESRPFWIYVFAVDAQELDFGRNSVDLSQLIQESIEKSHEGTRIRQWDKSFRLSGKAKGGELVLKLGFQIMEKDGGVGIYSQAEDLKSAKSKTFSSSFARKQSKTSFSVPSPKISSREAWTPSKLGQSVHDLHGIDELNLDEPKPVPISSSSSEPKPKEPEVQKVEDLDLPDFEVVDKGVEFQDKEEEYGDAQSEISLDEKSATSSEVVKEILQDQVHVTRLTELDSIAQQIKALESMMGEEKIVTKDEESGSQRLEADEETVTKEFLQMLEAEEIINEYKLTQSDIPPLQLEGAAEASAEAESEVFLPDLGKSLGCVVQTRDGGYLAAMNTLDTVVARKDTPKLAMQISKPFVLPWDQSISGFELFQRIAAIGPDELNSQISTLMSMDDLMDKTAEQIAFEGIASAIIQGRNKEGASSSAARTIASVKTMATAMSAGRKERISTGIWNVNENPFTAEEILAFSMQKIESMALEALKIQAEMAEEEAPFDVSPLIGTTATGGKVQNQPLASSISLEDWIKDHSLVSADDLLQPGDGHAETITLAVVVQLRDPLRRYEAVGGPIIAVIYATRADNTAVVEHYEEEKRFKVASLHVGGLKVRSRGGQRNAWDSEKQRLTAMQWLVSYGLAKAGKKAKQSAKSPDLLWSISSRVMADMWLKYMRNPDVKFIN